MLPFPIKICPVEIFTRATPGSSLVYYKTLFFLLIWHFGKGQNWLNWISSQNIELASTPGPCSCQQRFPVVWIVTPSAGVEILVCVWVGVALQKLAVTGRKSLVNRYPETDKKKVKFCLDLGAKVCECNFLLQFLPIFLKWTQIELSLQCT